MHKPKKPPPPPPDAFLAKNPPLPANPATGF
jgi:hypothetical protein